MWTKLQEFMGDNMWGAIIFLWGTYGIMSDNIRYFAFKISDFDRWKYTPAASRCSLKWLNTSSGTFRSTDNPHWIFVCRRLLWRFAPAVPGRVFQVQRYKPACGDTDVQGQRDASSIPRHTQEFTDAVKHGPGFSYCLFSNTESL